nr:hypothetical protein CFP56_43622 [Quercus suber]
MDPCDQLGTEELGSSALFDLSRALVRVKALQDRLRADGWGLGHFRTVSLRADCWGLGHFWTVSLRAEMVGGLTHLLIRQLES